MLSLQRRRKPPAELVRGKSLRYRKRLLCYNGSRSGNRSKSKGGEPFMANDNGSLSHTKWNCKYHIVFAPKYRRQVVYRQIKAAIGRIIRQLCEMKKVEIIEAEACPDHIHVLVSIPPNISVSQFVGYLKGKSSLMIFDRHANLKYKYGNGISGVGDTMWTRWDVTKRKLQNTSGISWTRISWRTSCHSRST